MKWNKTDTWYGLYGACVSKSSPLDNPLVNNYFRTMCKDASLSYTTCEVVHFSATIGIKTMTTRVYTLDH
eukprot:829077-Ditylum_brightwellii.AAC.1